SRSSARLLAWFRRSIRGWILRKKCAIECSRLLDIFRLNNWVRRTIAGSRLSAMTHRRRAKLRLRKFEPGWKALGSRKRFSATGDGRKRRKIVALGSAAKCAGRASRARAGGARVDCDEGGIGAQDGGTGRAAGILSRHPREYWRRCDHHGHGGENHVLESRGGNHDGMEIRRGDRPSAGDSIQHHERPDPAAGAESGDAGFARGSGSRTVQPHGVDCSRWKGNGNWR